MEERFARSYRTPGNRAKVMYHLYILLCTDDSFYTGITTQLRRRLKQHQKGEVAYTSTRLPVRLVYREDFSSEGEAVLREKQIKGWTRRKKAALIAGERAKRGAYACMPWPVGRTRWANERIKMWLTTEKNCILNRSWQRRPSRNLLRKPLKKRKP